MFYSKQISTAVAIVQLILLICVSAAPIVEHRHRSYQEYWRFQDNLLLLMLGFVLCVLGTLVIGIATRLNLDPHSPFATIFPQPLEGKRLVTTGLYRYIRHPQAAGYLTGALGYLLLMDVCWSLILWPICVVFLLFEIRFEEQLLEQRYPEYKEYKKQTKRLIPFVW